MILPSAWRSAEQHTAIATGQLAPWRGSRITRASWQKYLPPNCAPMPVAARDLEHLLLPLEIAERAAERAALGRQMIEVARRRELRDLERLLGARPADHDREVIRRTRRGAELTTAITAATPITTPSKVKAERSLFAQSDRSAMRMASRIVMERASDARTRASDLGLQLSSALLNFLKSSRAKEG